MDVDSIIARLVSASRHSNRLNVGLAESEIKDVCIKVREIFLSQDMLLQLEPPLKICGDIHGQLKYCCNFSQANVTEEKKPCDSVAARGTNESENKHTVVDF